MNLSLNDIPDEKLEAVLANLEAAKQQRQVENRLACYQPYQKQQAFHEAGATYRERLLTKQERRWRADSNVPCTPPADIQTGGGVHALRRRPSAG
jgi:hypothetical protein